METRNYAECQVKQVPSAFNLQHSHGVARQCHRLPRHKQRAAQPGLHTRQGCTPGPSRPLLNSQASHKQGPYNCSASKASSKPPRPARPLPNTQTSKASSKLPYQQGLTNPQASKASSKLPDQQGLPKTPRPARPQQLLSQQGSRKPPGLTSTGARLTSSYSRPTGRRHGPPGGQRAREQGNRETPGPSCSPRLHPCAMMSPCDAPWVGMRRAGRCKAAAALLPLPLPRPRPRPLVAGARASPSTAQAAPRVLMTKKKTTRSKARHKKNA